MAALDPQLNPPLAGPGRRPGWRFVFSHPAHALALGFGSGLAPLAPGTAGTLLAWAVYALLPAAFGDVARGAALAAAVLVGWWACTVTARHLGQSDPSVIVWDEIVSFWLVLWLVTPSSWLLQAVAFALFRFFDAAKPGPIAWADQRFKPRPGRPIGWAQGFGILVDDVAAAACTLLLIALWRFA
ncbi:MAG: phosphatidylglycerophosphatase A [Caldimonas sp.]